MILLLQYVLHSPDDVLQRYLKVNLLRFQSFNYRLACMAGNGKGANVAHVENLSK